MTSTDPSSSRRSGRWTLAAICAGLSGLAILAVLESAMARIDPDYRLLPPALQVLAYIVLVGLVATAVVVRRVEDGERRLARLLDARYAEGYTDGLTGRPAAPVLRLVRDGQQDR